MSNTWNQTHTTITVMAVALCLVVIVAAFLARADTSEKLKFEAYARCLQEKGAPLDRGNSIGSVRVCIWGET